MKKFGLIGFPLTHSFSKKYFSEKFQNENIDWAQYDNYEIDSIKKLAGIFEITELVGLNVTIPYKQDVIPFMDEIDPAAKEIGAINVIKIIDNKRIGFNSDYYGFKKSLEEFLGKTNIDKALILGTGGASKAVKVALKDMGIQYQYVSRTSNDFSISYGELSKEIMDSHQLIINTTPLGMHPKVDTCPAIPYELIGGQHFLYDLVYNPLTTLFMQKGLDQGAKAKAGLDMLHFQAEKAWEIWND